MNYKDYLKLGFKRTEMNDNVEFEETGYYGFCLGIEINDKISISVSSPDLDKPKLYIKKRTGPTYHIINITHEMVVDLLTSDMSIDNMYCRC